MNLKLKGIIKRFTSEWHRFCTINMENQRKKFYSDNDDLNENRENRKFSKKSFSSALNTIKKSNGLTKKFNTFSLSLIETINSASTTIHYQLNKWI